MQFSLVGRWSPAFSISIGSPPRQKSHLWSFWSPDCSPYSVHCHRLNSNQTVITQTSHYICSSTQVQYLPAGLKVTPDSDILKPDCTNSPQYLKSSSLRYRPPCWYQHWGQLRQAWYELTTTHSRPKLQPRKIFDPIQSLQSRQHARGRDDDTLSNQQQGT